MNMVTKQKKLKIDNDLIAICKEIEAEKKTDGEWLEVESSDSFQASKYCGGYDGVEREFTFSYFDKNDKEWWLQFSLSQVPLIIEGKLLYLDLNEPL